ncbi:MAG: OadG family protein [Clostridia bacterium]|nr:OadG family protein [Clostridia bacterium]
MKKVLCSVLALLMLFSAMALTIHAETPVEETGLFSPERWIYSGEMLVLGVGMVFLVLAILWGILTIFAKTMGGVKKSAKKEKPAKVETKPTPAPAPTAAPAPAVAASDDAIVAAITAAIAMTIDSDPALSSQFAGGFRVVSFRKKNGKTSWNH